MVDFNCKAKRSFQPRQAYVALSRVRSLEGVLLKNFDPSCLRVNKRAVTEMRRLRTEALLEYSPLPARADGSCTLMSLNNCGLLHKVKDLTTDMEHFNNDIVLIQETQLTRDIACLQHFTSFHYISSNSRFYSKSILTRKSEQTLITRVSVENDLFQIAEIRRTTEKLNRIGVQT